MIWKTQHNIAEVPIEVEWLDPQHSHLSILDLLKSVLTKEAMHTNLVNDQCEGIH